MVDEDLAFAVHDLIGAKFNNLFVLLNCFDFIGRKARRKTEKALLYMSYIDVEKMKTFRQGVVRLPGSFGLLRKHGVVRLASLDVTDLEQLRAFKIGIEHFSSTVEVLQRHVRTRLLADVKLEDLL